MANIITKTQLIKKVDGIGNHLLSLSIEFKTLSKSLNARKDELTLKEMKAIVKSSKIAEVGLLRGWE